MNERELQYRADELDALLDGRQASLPEEDLELAEELLHVAKLVKPASKFSYELQTLLAARSGNSKANFWHNIFSSHTLALIGSVTALLVFSLFYAPHIFNDSGETVQVTPSGDAEAASQTTVPSAAAEWLDLPMLPRLGVSAVYANANLNELFPEAEWVLQAELPKEPEEAAVYKIPGRTVDAVESAVAVAGKLGMEGRLYQTVFPDGSTDQNTYVVVDGAARLWSFDQRMISYEADITRSNDEHTPAPPFDELWRLAEKALVEKGLLDFDFQVEPSMQSSNEVIFTPVLDGYPVTGGDGFNPEIVIALEPDGSIRSLRITDLEVEPFERYPLRSAAQAWDDVLNGKLAGRFGYQVQQILAPAQQMNWSRSYTAGEELDLYGVVDVLKAVDGEELLVTLDGIRLLGDVKGVEHVPGNIHAWGTIQMDGRGSPELLVEGWEESDTALDTFEGILRLEGQTAALETAGGSKFEILSAPQDLPAGEAALISGSLVPGSAQIEWVTIHAGEAACRSYSSSYSYFYAASGGGGSGGGGGGGGGGGLSGGNAEQHNMLCAAYGNVHAGSISGGFDNIQLQNQAAFTQPALYQDAPYQNGERIEGLVGVLEGMTYVKNNGEKTPQFTLRVSGEDSQTSWSARLELNESAGLENLLVLEVRVWGEYQNVEGENVIKVERFEAANPEEIVQVWQGSLDVIDVEGKHVVRFTTTGGEQYILESYLNIAEEYVNYAALENQHTIIEGVLHMPEKKYGSYPLMRNVLMDACPQQGCDIQHYQMVTNRMMEIHVQPEMADLIRGQVTIDDARLVYLTMGYVQSGAPDDYPTRYIQPLWAFSGHLEDGRVVSLYVQAVQDQFLQ